MNLFDQRQKPPPPLQPPPPPLEPPPQRWQPQWDTQPDLTRVSPNEVCYVRVKVVQAANDLVITDAGLVERPVVWVQTVDKLGQATEPDRVLAVREEDLITAVEAAGSIRRAIYSGALS